MLKKQTIFRVNGLQRRSAYAGLVALLFLLLVACGPSVAPDATGPASDQSNSESASPLQPVEESAAEAGTAEEAYPPQAIEESAAEEGYPVQPFEEDIAEEAYPVVPLPVPSPTIDPENYPPPPPEEVFAEPRFRFDLPLNAGNTLVTGQAPPDLALAIADVTLNGAVLGTGVSDRDGRFSIGVQELPDGHRVGITFAELQAGKTLADMSREYFPHRGEGFMNLPNLGIFFDTEMVQP
jgi:hypothetical protein